MINTRRWRSGAKLRELIIFSMFAAMMFCSKLIMEGLPNIHPLGMFVMLLSVVYRVKALIPIYGYVMLQGLYSGFDVWWIPYLYIWIILWGITMLLPKKMHPAIAAVVYPVTCGLFGLLFGALYAPAQAILFGFTFKQTLAWIAAGLTFDILHSAGNAAIGCLVLPLSKVLIKLESSTKK